MRKVCLAIVSALAICASIATAQECGVIYVTTTGASSGQAGTRANPASLAYGLTLVNATDNRVWVATGTYNISNALDIPSNAIIDGGFDGSTWIKSNNPKSVIHRDASNILQPQNALIGLNAANASNFSLHDLTIQIDAAPTTPAQISVYGIYLSGCSNYNIIRCEVITGAAGPGVDGTPGTDGVDGNNGVSGLPGNGNEAPEPGGAGGTGSSAGTNDGGAGARGGRWSSGGNVNGSPGLPGGCGGTGGATRSGGDCSCGNPFDGCPGNCGQRGANGGNAGAAGTAGTAGTVGSAGSVVGGYYQGGGVGGNGTAGGDGCGGGGGGGGGGRQDCGTDAVGGSGGGGGGGGGGGTGGTGGTGGGGAFAVFLVNNGANGLIQDCTLQPGAGGAGGNGGAGGAGGTGGTGGTGGPGGSPCGNSGGGNGGNGSDGGAGGAGGSGATGASEQISENGGTPVSAVNNNGVPGNPPVLSVENPGCTNAEIIFNSAGGSNWNFGTGASPATGSGGGPLSTVHSSTGRKDIVLDGVTFTQFVDIFRNQAGGGTNTISNANNPAVVGCPDTFTTTMAGGSLYEWDFGPNAIPPTAAGPTLTSVPVAFTNPGPVTVVLWVTMQCCGRVRDTLALNLVPNNLNITLTPSANDICENEDIVYTATPATYQLYNFYVNGVLVQTSASNTYTATGLAQGDSVRVSGFDGICFTNPSTLHFPTVNPIPTVSLSSTVPATVCSGDQVTFTAAPTGYASYEFFNNGVSVQLSASEVYTANAAPPDMSVTVVATDAGCSSNPSNAIAVAVTPTPDIVINAVPGTSVCIGDAVTLTAAPAGLTNYDFTVNGVSVQNTATDFYTAVFDDGDVIIVNGASGVCNLPADTVTMTVTPVPSVTLNTSMGPDICAGDSVVFVADPSGYPTYEFYDGTTVVQSGTSNVYTTTGLTSGNNVTVVASIGSCVSPASNAVSLNVNPRATADFIADPLESDDLATVFTFTNNSTNADSYVWNFGDNQTSTVTSPTHVYADTGTYTITLIAANQFNCNDTMVRPAYITILEKPILYVPNVFTPNGDGLNDDLVVSGSGIRRYKLQIYNRWGEMVFISEDITNHWDGTYQGKELNPAVYVYDLFVEFTSRKIHRQNGSITLLR